MSLHRWGLGLLIAVGAAVGACGSASASSIVYIKGGNVWVASPDGAHQYQVTADGTAGDPYSRPSQAKDGTIVAVRGTQPARLYRLAQNGAQLNAPFATASPGAVIDAEVSPNGQIVAYSFINTVNPCTLGCAQTQATVAYTYADHFGAPNNAGLQNEDWHWISWAGSARTILTNDSNLVYYDDVGGGDNSSQQWYDECTAGLQDCSQGSEWGIHDAVVSSDGRKAAWIWQQPGNDPYTVSDVPYLQIGTLGGDVTTDAPPAPPTTPACNIAAPQGFSEQAGQSQWDRPTFSPDASQIAWSEPDGIHVARASLMGSGTSTDCQALRASDHLVISGASQPSWGLADAAPAPVQPPGTGGGGSQTGPAPGPSTGTGAPGPSTGSGNARVPAPSLGLPGQRLARILRSGELDVSCRLTAPGRCLVTLTIPAAAAKRLHLPRSRSSTYVLASASATEPAATTRRLRLRFSAKVTRALRHLRRLDATLTATASSPAGRRSTRRVLHIR